MDLAVATLADRIGGLRTLPAETRAAVLRARVDAFIDANLGDPHLNPAAIAAHHHISLRSLHQLFHGEPETVAATIRRRRLERCRDDLVDPAMRHHGVGEISARWGFRHPADFSRAMRKMYGTPPTEIRAQALGSDDLRDPC
ncbi:helix-turn-helix domain-containing protein [Yinghuangia soli]|uniref:Helix-turn-helix domain-containing protein n=1 Tax=Yinghuangia soli TaxID=2908204 RepID=A0AA41Q8Q9_9ACTN|nr:helix-turn-helix domain-containing protein [Yinghuangia soli]MCF2533674.1 helix-turn-helix domain-containing protein [Yinghuangia soli]